MQAARFRRVENLFHAALALGPARREVFLRSECGDDAQLRREVEALLAAAPAFAPSLVEGGGPPNS